VLAVLAAEHDEDLARLSGFTHDVAAARHASVESVGRRFRHRLPWLLLGLAGAVASADLVGSFEGQLERNVILAFFIPGIVYMADAVGTQTETLVVRVGRWRFLVAACSLWAFFAVAAMALAISGQGWPEFADLAPSGLLLMVLGQLVVVPFGEETGWRGFALPQLQRTRSPLGAMLVLAVVGALWHLPLFFFAESFRGLGVAYLPGFFLGMTAGYVVLTWIYNRTAGSILMVALWHGALNLTTGSDVAEGTIQAVVTTAIMVWGITLVVAELRARHQGHRGPLQQQPNQGKTFTQQGIVKCKARAG
jgi:membrane protease YdiL (CAAX protease family)